MTVESIGNVGSQTASPAANNNISQEEFIKLFLAQLNSQDPLEPLNNREFLAQLAQFSSLEQSRQSNEKLDNLLEMNSSNQALSLLGKAVQVSLQNSATPSGTIEAVHYTADGPTLTIKLADGSFLDKISLSQITIVQQ
ncbi:flagellar hook assembly protein FlgD [Pseudoalteromonas aurantia]|uniref:Basal-body rod modification protein FlgD n=1 Tax=Pseudoalteromonas aurantia TaxID=43654 RepID=A0A5S3V727_9GAMM|nr:flagellar hook capping FlgD N-terminal domain-containing protein [Pseudoalteromonas aurantia]TMO66634.1 flagellar hook capping protein [Pseudoalteromonas aurantia]